MGGVFIFGQKISFNKTTHDYGVLKYKADGKTTFVVENKGDKPLILTGVKAACGCTTPKWDSNPILPGKTSVIEVGYDTALSGSFKKLIEVYSNDPDAGRSVLWIKGEVEANKSK